jgi:2-keto-4-pentenoate hydratase/2-oxohepta-3-ene-1,7-dioic acid hydratase in catechol pathway
VHLTGWSKDVHHEVELAIELGPDLAPVRGAVALDLTARDVQSKLKAKQWP